MSSIMWQGCEQEFASSINPTEFYNALRRKNVYVFEPDDNIPRANLRNGGICYIHSKLFEVSTPECRTPRDIVAYDKASEAYARLASWALEEETGRRIHLYKTSIASDPKEEQSYTTVGAHENYLVKRKSYTENLHLLVPYLIARQIFCGSGGFVDGRYLISPRTIFPKTIYSATSTDYPIISTRDESHAGARYSRAHIVNGEGARSEYTTLLKFGITSYVLKAIELGFVRDVPEIEDPLITNKAIAADLNGDWRVPLKGGSTMKAIDLLNTYYLEGIEKTFAEIPTQETDIRILKEFRWVLRNLDEGDFEKLNTSIEWIIKWALVERWMDSLEIEEGLSFETAKVATLFQYSAVTDPFYEELAEKRELKRIVSEDEVERAFLSPPEESRGQLRTILAERLNRDIKSLNWSHLKLQPKIDYHIFEFNTLAGWTRERIEEKVREIEKKVLKKKR